MYSMKKNWLAYLLAPAMGLGLVSCLQESPVERPADGGAPSRPAIAARLPIGSTEPVTKCSTLAQLRAMRSSGNYLLTKNIDASATANAPFVPIGSIKNPFYGTFDGGVYTIDKLTISGGDYAGMFYWAANADLKNIHLTNVNVTGGRYTGAIAGRIQNSDLKDSYVTGTVTGNVQNDSRLGMFFGEASAFVRVRRSYATGTVKGWGKYVGGIIGRATGYGIQDPNDDFRVTVEEVFTNVTVNPSMPSGTSTIYAGGLIGYLVSGQIEDINVVGPVTGRNAAGGIVGHISNVEANSAVTNFFDALSRGVVTDNATPQRAGTLGTSVGAFGKCVSYWDKTTDTGTPNPNNSEPICQIGFTRDELRLAQTTTNPKHIHPYYTGTPVTQESVDGGVEACKLGSGSDGDWDFGLCPGDEVNWHANSSSEYNTLANIPNPGVQPK
jgi:hypothetical protein